MEKRPGFEEALGGSFYKRPVDEVARDLLGRYLVRRRGRGYVGGRIVETEAYGGQGDPASHAHRAPDGRARVMFGPPGTAYVYFTYGMHHCLNAVAEPEGTAGAVLIRALEPAWGIGSMRRGAPSSLPDHRLTSGPGRICRAMAIGRELNQSDLCTGSLRIVGLGSRSGGVHLGPRVGLSSDDGREWRFWLSSPSTSRFSSPRLGRRR